MKYIIAGVICFVLGAYAIHSDVVDNELAGYHCTKITTHTSLESAKAQVRVYQAKVATVHGIGIGYE